MKQSSLFYTSILLVYLLALQFQTNQSSPIPPSLHGYQVIDLYGNNEVDFTLMAEQWKIVGEITPNKSRVFLCQNDYFLGGSNSIQTNGYFERTYSSLPTHSVIYYQMRFLILDDWKFPDQFQLIFDDHQPFTWNPIITKTYYGTNVCGNSNTDLYYYYVQGKVIHTASTLKLSIISYIQQDPKFASIGLRGIRLLFGTKKAADVEGSCVALTENYQANTAVGIDNCVCPYGSYYNGATCATCHTSCMSCFGGSNTECYGCKNNYYWNGNQCLGCPSNCLYCTSGTKCTVCNPDFYLNRYSACQNSCHPPYLPLGDGVYWVCQTPCQPDKYMYWDDTCESTCDFPLSTRIEGLAMFCDYSCTDPTHYLHWTGICVSTCTTQPRIRHWKKFCFPCPEGLYLYPNGTCISFCETPYTIQTIGGVDFCQPLCPTGEYLIGNACFPTCNSPLYPTNVNGLNICNSPCPNDFLYWNSSCLTTCPFIQRSIGIYKFCDACANNYFLYPDGSCQPTCDPPRRYFMESIFRLCYFPCGGSSGVYSADAYDNCPVVYEYPLQLTPAGKCVLNLTDKEFEQATIVGNVLNKFGGVVSGLAVLALVVNNRDSRPFCFILSLKMLEYLKYIIAKYPPFLQQVLNTLNFNLGVVNIAPNIPSEAKEEFIRYSVPHQYNEFNFHSSFIVNSWDALISFVIVAIIIGIILGSEAYLKDMKYVSWLIQKIKPALKLPSFLLIFLISSYYIDINIHASIELRTLHLYSFLAVLSFLIALFMKFLLIFMLVKVFLAFKEARKILTQVADARNPSLHARDLKKISDYYIFFAICNKEAYYQHAFIFVSIMRAYVFSFVLAYMFEHAFVQSVLMLLLSVMMLLYLIFVRPLKRDSHLIQFIAMEAILFIPNLCVLILNVLNGICSESHQFRTVLGGFFIASHFLLLVCGAGSLIIAIIRRVFGKEIIEDFKSGKTDFKLKRGDDDVFETIIREQPPIISPWEPISDSGRIRKKRNDDGDHRNDITIENVESRRPREIEMQENLSEIRHDTSKLMMLNTNESQIVASYDQNNKFENDEDLYNFDNNSQLNINPVRISDDFDEKNKRRR